MSAVADRELPPGDRTEMPEHDAVLAGDFKAFIDSIGMSQSQAARKIGVDSSALSVWINGAPKGAWRLLEARAADFLKTEPLRRKVSEGVFETATVTKMRAVVADLLETNHLAMFVGDSGIGKTMAIHQMLSEHALAILVTAYTLGGSAGAMLHRLQNSISMRGFRSWCRKNPGGTHLDFIVEHFKGSGRLFIVDNCHRLTVTGIEFWFDFRDQTGCPVMFVGCREFMDRLARVRNNDQQLSRTAELWDVKMDGASQMARGLIKQFLPEHLEALLPLAARVADRPGHGRALFFRLELTRKALLRMNGSGDVRTLFEDSRALLPARSGLTTDEHG